MNIEHLFNLPNIQELKLTNEKSFNTIELFSRYDYATYKRNKDLYLELSENLLNKLKKISLISIASETKILNFNNLIILLDLSDQFELDKLLLECNTSGWVVGKIDHINKIFKVSEIKSRDYIKNWESVENKIKNWLNKIEKVEKFIENQSNSINKSQNEYENFLEVKSQAFEDNLLAIANNK